MHDQRRQGLEQLGRRLGGSDAAADDPTAHNAAVLSQFSWDRPAPPPQPPKKNRRFVTIGAAVVAVFALLLGISRCGSDEDDAPSSVTETVTTTVTQPVVVPTAPTTTTTTTTTTTSTTPVSTSPAAVPTTTDAVDLPPVDAPRTPYVPDTTATLPSAPSGVYYSSCAEARDAGAAPLYRGEPGYRSGLDRDGDGIACDRTG